MNTKITTSSPNEQNAHLHRHLVCWKSVFAGFALSILCFAGIISLALAFGGVGLSDGSTVRNAGLFAGVSVVVATVLAIFIGSYFSVRLARFKVDVVGCAQGLVVASLVVGFVLWQTFSAVGMIGRAAAEATGTAAIMADAGAESLAREASIRMVIEDSFGPVTLKSEPSVVAAGVSTRLLRGDREGAKNYFARQADLTPAEADARIAVMKQRMDESLVKARDASATALKTAGWSLFVMITLSAIASVLGGLLGAQVNLRRTLDVSEAVPVRRLENNGRILQDQPVR